MVVNKYTVTDPSGAADVYIDPKAWGGQRVGAADIVLLQGKVKKDKKNTIIDVMQVVKQQGSRYGLDHNHGPVSGPVRPATAGRKGSSTRG